MSERAHADTLAVLEKPPLLPFRVSLILHRLLNPLSS